MSFPTPSTSPEDEANAALLFCALIVAFTAASDKCSSQFKCPHAVLGMTRLPRRVLGSMSESMRRAGDKVRTMWLWTSAGFFKWRDDTAGGWFKRWASKEVLEDKKGYFDGNVEGAKQLVAFGNERLDRPKHHPLGPKTSAAAKQSYKRSVHQNHFLHIAAAGIDAESVTTSST